MLTADLQEIDWPYSDMRVCSFCTLAQLERINHKDAAIRCHALSELSRNQARLLFNKMPATGRRRYALGLRIRNADVLSYCLDSYEDKLWKVFGRFKAREHEKTWTRKDLVKALLALG